MCRMTLRACQALAIALAMALPALAAEPIKVGSKRFTESYVLGEIARQTLQRAGVPAEHRQGAHHRAYGFRTRTALAWCGFSGERTLGALQRF